MQISDEIRKPLETIAKAIDDGDTSKGTEELVLLIGGALTDLNRIAGALERIADSLERREPS